MPFSADSTSDSQTGGECFPPSSESAGENEDSFGRARSSSQPSSFRRTGLSLNISSLPGPFQNVSLQSPGSLASSGAPFTDSFSLSNPQDFPHDYFEFGQASLPSEDAGVATQQFGYRLPASQPSSPVRTIFPPGQAPFNPQGGRQRGATFSGGSFTYQDQFGGPLFSAVSQPNGPASAIPPHFAFTSIANSPINSPALGSPLVQAAPSGVTSEQQAYFDAVGANAGLGVGEVLMEDVSTPTQGVPVVQSFAQAQAATAPPSRRSSFGQPGQPVQGNLTPDMSLEMVDKLTLLDQIVNSAQEARTALLRGQEVQVSTNLSQINHQLEIASELGVGPVPTPRDVTPASQSVSPVSYQASTSPANATGPGAPQLQMTAVAAQPPVQPMQQTIQPMQGLLPSLPVAPAATGATTINPTLTIPAVPGAPVFPDAVAQLGQAPAPPPLVHSHSFPNGHQLPSQLHGITAPTTPMVPSPSFTASLGIQHAPHISSPLASMPVSRPTSPPRPYSIPEQPWAEALANADIPMTRGGSDVTANRRVSDGAVRPDGRPVVGRGRSASITKKAGIPTMTSSLPPSAWQSRQTSPEDDDDDESEDEGPRRTKRRRSSVGNDALDLSSTNAVISDDMRRQLDQIFEDFLNRVCSDLEICDSKGEKLHQVLMPKKMQRLDESTDFRPFKFRIQAFTNAFHEEQFGSLNIAQLQARGITEETMSSKKVKTYLWRQDLISRFNSDGKKAKSKGNHIWNVDAKKLPGGGWVFRPFKRRIIGQPNAYVLVGQRYEWEPRIWDPQAASDTIKPTFKSPPGTLPPWLRWEDGSRLVGIPDQPTGPIPIIAIGEFADGSGSKQTLDTTFNIQAVIPMTDPNMYAQAGFVPWTGDYPAEQGIHPNLLGQPMLAYPGAGIAAYPTTTYHGV
ncbi:hypothetical protein JCM24511_00432 [Saitozyma sp. JCM 24511]|nr:hypothetical protein JCM24511_00432 [Saitozyma sp. JCM 24511]